MTSAARRIVDWVGLLCVAPAMMGCAGGGNCDTRDPDNESVTVPPNGPCPSRAVAAAAVADAGTEPVVSVDSDGTLVHLPVFLDCCYGVEQAWSKAVVQSCTTLPAVDDAGAAASCPDAASAQGVVTDPGSSDRIVDGPTTTMVPAHDACTYAVTRGIDQSCGSHAPSFGLK